MKKLLVSLIAGLFAIGMSASSLVKSGTAIEQGESMPSVEGKTKWTPAAKQLIMPVKSTKGLSGSMLDPDLTPQQSAKHRAQGRVSASGSTIQGHLKASSSADFPNGWWDVNLNGQVTKLWGSTALMGSCGFVRDGKICQFTTINSYGYYWFYYSEYDLATGEELYEIELPDNDGRNYVINCAYDSDADIVYMQTYNQVLSGMAWSTFDPETHERGYLNNSVSWDDNRVVAIGWNPRDQKIYGVTEDARFVTLDKNSGTATKVAQLPVEIYTYSQSMVFSPLDHAFVWAAMYTDNTSGFALIDPATGAYTAQGQMAAQNEFVQLYCPDEDYDDSTPDLPTNLSVSFDKAALNGTITFNFPTTTFGGTALAQNTALTAVVMIDDVQYTTVNGTPGSAASTTIQTTQGQHVLKVGVKQGNAQGAFRELVFYAGNDTPNAPTNVVINENSNTISWTASSGGVHGGYVDPSAIRYNVYLSGKLVNSQPTASTSVTFTPPTSLGIYVATVVAVANGLTSEPGESEGVKYGEIFDMPFFITPTKAEFDMCTVVDNNNDGTTWQLFEEQKKFYYYSPYYDNGGDEWLFFPKAHFTSSENLYLISMDLMALLASCPENMEIWLSTSTDPKDAFLKVGEFTNYVKDSWSLEKVKFAITQAGDYHIAFRATSTNGFLLNLRNITVDMTTDTKRAPADCKGVTLTGGENGALEAIITLYAPTKNIAGDALDTTKEITVHATSDAGTSSTKVLPGAQATFKVPTFQGTNTVWIVPQNEGGYGIEHSYSVYTGVEKPGPVRNVVTKLSDDGLTMTLTWDAPEIGENGGYINPDEVQYQIYTAGDEMWIFREDIGKAKTYTYTIPAGSQSLQQVAVAGYNVAGTTSSSNFKGAARIMGTPHKLPYSETFTWGIPDHLPILITKPTGQHTASWTLNDPTAYEYGALSPDYGALVCQPVSSGESFGRVEFPIISTAGYNNATFRLDAFRFARGGKARVLAKTGDDVTYTTIGEVDLSKGSVGYVNELYRLPAKFQNRPWVAFAIEAEFNVTSTDNYVIIDNFHVIDLPDNDLMAVITEGPLNIVAGNTAEYTGEIYNNGKNLLTSSAVWEVLDGEKVIASKDVVVSPLEPEESEETTFSFTPTSDLAEANLTVRLTVKASVDDAPANDSYSANLFVRSDGLPTVTDLEGSVDDAGFAALTWSAPATGALTTDNFETLTDGDYAEELGEWTNLDLDGKDLYFISNSTLVDAGEPKAWQVISTETAGLNTFAANSGKQFLMAIVPLDGSAANDWLISPEVQGGSLVEITANILSPDYPETFEVLSSTGSTDPNDFVLVERFTKSTLGWEVIPVRLPADAARFAIRYCSIDEFGMMLDDIAYVPADADKNFSVVSYNVYCNNEKIAENVAATTFNDNDFDNTNVSTYFVTANITSDNGTVEGGRSNYVTLGTVDGVSDAVASNGSIRVVDGGVLLCGFEGRRFVVVSIDGRVIEGGIVDTDARFVALAHGLYVVKAADKSAKVIVK